MPQSIDSTDTHALSELENLSDSDWLDIASSRASEDTDSVVGFDSDRELDHDDRPTSSHSYRSTSSSRHSEIRAWEGLLEDIPDECHTAARPLTRPTALSSDGAHAAAPTAQEEDPEEEQRVKDALDQSMMSTLSSSRSNTLSGSHSSLVRSRDLRLSFPDPLTSSREDSLNASFEAVAPEDDASPAVDSGADSSPHGTDDIDVKKALTAADPGMLPTPVVPDVEESREETPIKPDFYVVLYGASSAVKWSLIDKLLEKVAAGVGLTLTSRIVGLIDGYVRFLSSNDYKDGRAVWVIDRTDSADTSSFTPLDRPSLAVVFLPSSLSFVPDHSLYLPILAQSPSVLDVPFAADQLLDAEQQWDTLNIHRSKVVPISRCSSSVVDVDEVERVTPKQLARVLRPVLAGEVQRAASLVQRIAPRHALTILAILSVVLGYAIQGSFNPRATPTVSTPEPQQTTPSFAFPSVAVSINHSTSPSVNPTTSGRSALKDFALAVLPAPLVASTSASQASAMPSTHRADPVTPADAPSECGCGCGLITWSGKSDKGTTDLVLHPTSSTPSMHDAGKSGMTLLSSPQYTGKGKAVARGDTTAYALSSWIGGGVLAELLGIGYGVIAHDVQEILDALDELARVIAKQTALVWAQSTGAVNGLKSRLQARHERARARALELREMGGKLFESVQERVRARVGRARENARAAKEEVLGVDAWPVSGRQVVEAVTARRLARERRAYRKARSAFSQ